MWRWVVKEFFQLVSQLPSDRFTETVFLIQSGSGARGQEIVFLSLSSCSGDEMGRDGVAWLGMGRDEMGWDEVGWDEMMRRDGPGYHRALEFTTQLLHPVLHQKPPKELETAGAKEGITCQEVKPLGAGAGKGFSALMGRPSSPKHLQDAPAKHAELVIPAWQDQAGRAN